MMGPINRFSSRTKVLVVVLLIFASIEAVQSHFDIPAKGEESVGDCSGGFCSLRRPATQGGTCSKAPWPLYPDQEGALHFNVCSRINPHDPRQFDALCQPGCEFYWREAGWTTGRLVENNAKGTIAVSQVPSDDEGDLAKLEHLHWQTFEHNTYIRCCRIVRDGGEDCTEELCFYLADAKDHAGYEASTGRDGESNGGRVNPPGSVQTNTGSSVPRSDGDGDTFAKGLQNPVFWIALIILGILSILIIAMCVYIRRSRNQPPLVEDVHLQDNGNQPGTPLMQSQRADSPGTRPFNRDPCECK
ncbi:hypothetical protein BV898_15598 [Hypsibius exemplaris]|uniref:Transmembrane protein n=1 Tax=Hypsibius exemplaris TaxID=2072580 RepID=A0A9X6NKG9_HYPEX|nr:hypothetical protein BV898_15598 [Hypsibius exemplaris]